MSTPPPSVCHVRAGRLAGRRGCGRRSREEPNQSSYLDFSPFTIHSREPSGSSQGSYDSACSTALSLGRVYTPSACPRLFSSSGPVEEAKSSLYSGSDRSERIERGRSGRPRLWKLVLCHLGYLRRICSSASAFVTSLPFPKLGRLHAAVNDSFLTFWPIRRYVLSGLCTLRDPPRSAAAPDTTALSTRFRLSTRLPVNFGRSSRSWASFESKAVYTIVLPQGRL